MLRNEDVIRLRHMLDASREAVEFAKDRSPDDLEADRQLTLSLVRCLEVIGEAAANLSSECRQSHAGIPWADIMGPRNRLIHAYFDVNLTVVWRTVNDDLPVLVSALQRILDTPA